MSRAGMTTLVAPIPEAEPLVSGWRARYDWSASRGVPAHITLLGPFLPPDRVGSEVIEQLRALFAACAAFSFALAGVRSVGGVVFLAPEPVTPFERLTSLLEGRFPDAPRYGSTFQGAVHHLTVARSPTSPDEVTSTLEGMLPVQATVREARLLEQAADGHIQTVTSFALAEVVPF